jgi:hypothetical protein
MSPDGHRPRTLPLIVALGFYHRLRCDGDRPISAGLSRHRPFFRSKHGMMQTSLAVFVGAGAIGQLSEEEK